MGRRQGGSTQAMKKALSKHDKCELCGSTRQIEAHHIIPVCVGGPDIEENIIAICSVCHAKLTPRSVLIKLGIRRIQENPVRAAWIEFYERCEKKIEEDKSFDFVDAMDTLDEVMNKASEKYETQFTA
jgi:hypothetical protein